jgi:hypothetical protein
LLYNNYKMLEDTKQINQLQEITERHKNARPPYDAYLYIPNHDEVIEINDEDSKSRRKIFDIPEENYTTFEKDSLKQFQIELDNYNKTATNTDEVLILPLEWNTSDTLRFLQAKSYKIAETVKAIHKYINWMKSYFPIQLTNGAIEILNSGFIYGHGRDYRYRPIFVIRSEIYIKLAKNYSYDDWLMALTYFCDYLVNNMTIPGQLENWIIIADMSNISLLQLPTEVTKLVSVLQSNFKCRLLKVYVFGMNQVLNFIWSFVKSMLQPNTLKKIKFLNTSNPIELFENINPDQVEKRYGGNSPNLVDNYFPPYMSNENIFLPDEKKQDILISEEVYKELYLNGKLTVLSPYIQINDAKSTYINTHTYISRRFTSKLSVYSDALSHISEERVESSMYEICKEDVELHDANYKKFIPRKSESRNKELEGI